MSQLIKKVFLKNNTSHIAVPTRRSKWSMQIISCAFLTTSSDQLPHSLFFVSGEINPSWGPNCSNLISWCL